MGISVVAPLPQKCNICCPHIKIRPYRSSPNNEGDQEGYTIKILAIKLAESSRHTHQRADPGIQNGHGEPRAIETPAHRSVVVAEIVRVITLIRNLSKKWDGDGYYKSTTRVVTILLKSEL